jgi:hypothetical protein
MYTRFNEKIIDALSALNTVGLIPPFQGGHYTESAFYIRFNAGVTAGAVVIETAADSTDTGTWANLTTVNWSAADKTHHVAVTGVFRALRARISSAILTGTVDVVAVLTG